MNRELVRVECAACEVVDFGDYRMYGLDPNRAFSLKFRFPKRVPPAWFVRLVGPEDEASESEESVRGLWQTREVHFRVRDILPAPQAGWHLTTCQFEVMGWGAHEQDLVVMVEPAGSRERGLIMSRATWQATYAG